MKHDTPSGKDYSKCLIKPMTENGEGRPIIEPAHILDAFIVATIVFFSIIIGDAMLGMWRGDVVLLTVDEVARRLVTAGLAFGLTFFAQWARYRGIKFMVSLPIRLDDGDDEQ